MRSSKGLLLLALSVTALFGCAGPSIYQPFNQTHFAYPNSNVIPLGHARGSASKSYINLLVYQQMPDFGGTALFEEAATRALSGSGGDLIIDGTYQVSSTIYPLVTVVNATVDGTAAKMEIGKRKLR